MDAVAVERKPLLDVRGLAISLVGRNGPTKVVHDVSIKAFEGQSIGIVGESGCGKSISMLGLTGLLPRGGRVTDGAVIFQGDDLQKASPKRRRELRGGEIGFVFQDPMTSLNPVMTIGDQIAEVLVHKRSMSKSAARARAAALLREVGIPGAEQRIDAYPHQLSGGMRQRVMIAMGIACEPALLIADEPTTALDVTIQAQIVELLQRLSAEKNMAIIWITHDLALISGVVEWINVLYAGRVVESGPVDQIYYNPAHPYTRGLLASLPRIAETHAAKLHTIPGAPPDPRLETPGCAFAPRCASRVARCSEQRPELSALSADSRHRAACFVTASSPAKDLRHAG
jgi:peptide/nickel transport system ATP-binding protein